MKEPHLLKLMALTIKDPAASTVTAVALSKSKAMLTPAPHRSAVSGRFTSPGVGTPGTPRAGTTRTAALTWRQSSRTRTLGVQNLNNIVCNWWIKCSFFWDDSEKINETGWKEWLLWITWDEIVSLQCFYTHSPLHILCIATELLHRHNHINFIGAGCISWESYQRLPEVIAIPCLILSSPTFGKTLF